MADFHNAQTPEDIPGGEPEKQYPIVYRVTREIGDRCVGPMEYHYEACADYFYLCASCGLKDKDAERLSDRETAHVIEYGQAEYCADCEDDF